MRRGKSILGVLVLVLGMAKSSGGQPIITTVAGGGVGDGGPATTAGLYDPSGVFVDAQGNLFIADAGNKRIRKVSGIAALAGLDTAAVSPLLTVTSTGDSGDRAPGDGVCGDPRGACTLRAALQEANARAGTDVIHFALPGSGPHSIAPLSPLPFITDPLVLDATSQPDFADTPIVELDGSQVRMGAEGLVIQAGRTTVKGLAINRFQGSGIRLEKEGGNVIEGCFIGTDITGKTARGNRASGIFVDHVSANRIGGTTPGAGNLISGNDSTGVAIGGSVSTGNRVQGNLIGTDAAGTLDLGNALDGVRLDREASANTVGGPTVFLGNTIAFNRANGVGSESGTGNAVLSNALFANGKLGIDLGLDGVTANDPEDQDTGANKGQNFPVLKTASSGRTLSGTLAGDPRTSYRIEFFASRTGDPSGHGEGETVLDSLYATTDDSGQVNFTAALRDPVPVGWFITATATNPAGNTSEFSAYLAVPERETPADLTGIIITVAGNGTYGFSGDGGPATKASLWLPTDVVGDGAGNLYLADANNDRIRKVDAAGVITTVAGNGERGFSGDGGPATKASLNEPYGIFADHQGNLYIADRGNDRIRKVDAAGVITTVAGNGERGFSGDGGPATKASLATPQDVFVDDQDNLYIADMWNNRIRKVDSAGVIIAIAGNGEMNFSGDGGPATEAGLVSPGSIFVDAQGNLFIADGLDNRIRKVDAAGVITTVAGNGEEDYSGDGGPATTASLWLPADVVGDGAGNLYLADALNNRIRKVDAAGVITTVAGNGERNFSGDGGSATEAGLVLPGGIFVDAQGNLFIADAGSSRLRKVSGVATPTSISPASPALSLTSETVHFDDVPFDALPAVGDTAVRSLTIANTGDLPLHLSAIAVDHPAFAVVPGSASLDEGDSLHITLRYAPREVRLDTTALVLISNDPERPEIRLPVYAAALGSSGPRLETSAIFYLGAVSLGDSALFHLPVKNSGNRSLTITFTAVDEKTFALEQDTLTIAPGERDSLTIIFSPEAPGQVEGALSLHSDDPLQPLVRVTLIGAGEPSGPEPRPAPVTGPGDFDGDGQVNFADFFLFADRFGAETGDERYGEPYDLDRNGQIDFADFFLFSDFFQVEERSKLIALASKYLGLPLASCLELNYPNPFNTATTIRYQLGTPGRVRLEIFDLAGQQIQTLVDAGQQPGLYQITWDGTDRQGIEVSTGPYLIRLQVGAFIQVRKMLLIQ